MVQLNLIIGKSGLTCRDIGLVNRRVKNVDEDNGGQGEQGKMGIDKLTERVVLPGV